MNQKYNYIMPCHKISPAKKHVDLYLSIRWMVDSIRMDVLFANFTRSFPCGELLQKNSSVSNYIYSITMNILSLINVYQLYVSIQRFSLQS